MKDKFYVSFEIAQQLKEKGYPQDLEDNDIVYAIKDVTWQNTYEGNPYTYKVGERIYLAEEYANGSYRTDYSRDDEEDYIVCPTFEEVQDWLWENHHIHINFETDYLSSKNIYLFWGVIETWNGENSTCKNSDHTFYTKEEAMSNSIKEVLKNL